MADEMKVWVGNLGAYNAGNLRGEWLDPLDPAFDEACEKIVGDGEFYVADAEGFFGLKVEKMSLSEIKALAEKLEEMGDDAEAFAKWCDHTGEDSFDADENSFRDAYQGHHNSEEDFVQNLCEDIGHKIPDYIRVDWEATARDFFISDYFSVECSTGGIYVFSNI